jgi:hypothetical protein
MTEVGGEEFLPLFYRNIILKLWRYEKWLLKESI